MKSVIISAVLGLAIQAVTGAIIPANADIKREVTPSITILNERSSSFSSAADPNDLHPRARGCHAKAKDFYFSPGAAAVCNQELVKGYFPNGSWNEGLMHLCFWGGNGLTGCDGGLQLGP
ncbi:MAG: hypothetical protein Q9182_005859 [Xanthomendoza sp. 2 TL-2023]